MLSLLWLCVILWVISFVYYNNFNIHLCWYKYQLFTVPMLNNISLHLFTSLKLVVDIGWILLFVFGVILLETMMYIIFFTYGISLFWVLSHLKNLHDLEERDYPTSSLFGWNTTFSSGDILFISQLYWDSVHTLNYILQCTTWCFDRCVYGDMFKMYLSNTSINSSFFI